MLRVLRPAPRGAFLLTLLFAAPLATATAAAAPPAAAPARPPAARPPVKKPPPVVKPSDARPPDAKTLVGKSADCPPGNSSVTLLPTESEIKCNEVFDQCEGELQLVARNCSGEFQSFMKVEIYEHGRRSLVLDFSPATIAPHKGLWSEKIPWLTPGELEAVVYYRPPGGSGDGEPTRANVRMVNKALATAKAACEKCQGTWARFGVNKYESCNCRTTDANKECTDGDQCQGYCLFTRYNNEGYEYGLCSETTRLSGCRAVVEKGQSKLPPNLAMPRKRTTCFD